MFVVPTQAPRGQLQKHFWPQFLEQFKIIILSKSILGSKISPLILLMSRFLNSQLTIWLSFMKTVLFSVSQLALYQLSPNGPYINLIKFPSHFNHIIANTNRKSCIHSYQINLNLSINSITCSYTQYVNGPCKKTQLCQLHAINYLQSHMILCHIIINYHTTSMQKMKPHPK